MNQKPVSNPASGDEVNTPTPAPAPAPAPQPVVTIASASQTVAELVSRLPALASVKTELQLIAGLYVAYPANPLGSIPLKEAVQELKILYHTDPIGVRDALTTITKLDAKAATELADEFQSRTGRKLSTTTLDIGPAVSDETKEQQTQDRLARGLLVNIQIIVNRLSARDLYTLHHQTEKKPVRGNFVVSLVNHAAERVIKPESKSVQPEPAPADWLTPPILDPSNADYNELIALIDLIIKLMDRYASQSNMRQIVLDYLAPTEVNDIAKIEIALERASELAHDQLKQSNEILALVGRDQQVFADRIDGLHDLRHMYGAVAAFFFPGK